MMDRCYKPNHIYYKRYGARGITVEPFLQDVVNYIQYITTLPRYDELLDGAVLEVDRIDNNGNYARGNLRFATKSENRLNQMKRETDL
jgi:hypothetical protein